MGRFFRWVPKQHAASAINSGLISHNTSALWIFEMGGGYRPSMTHNAYLIAYDLDDTATENVRTVQHIDFESDTFQGEAAHPNAIIVKNNESGAYGLGKTRQKITNLHVTAIKYATKKEAAKALGRSELEVDSYKPPGGWP